jgi:hypothetical protein
MFGALAAVAGASAYAIRPNNNSNNQTSDAVSTAPATGISQGPTQTQNVQRLGSGGIVSRKQIVQIGDDQTGTGNAKEAVLPLESPTAMKQIADAINPFIDARAALLSAPTLGALLSAPTLGAVSAAQRSTSASDRVQGSSVTTNEGDVIDRQQHQTTVIIQGLVSDDKLSSIVRKINRLVKNNDVQLTASSALRVTRKA